MKKEKQNILISAILIVMSIIFTILVMKVDVKPIGPLSSFVGFSTINGAFSTFIGYNHFLYILTEIAGYFSITIAVLYFIIGVIQLIQRKNVFKVDKEILALGVLYTILLALWVIFDNKVVNFRPVLINGLLDPSYPSSHTLMSMCVCISAMMVNKTMFKGKYSKLTNTLSITFLTLTVIGRLLSGAHWITDIIGGLLMASALLYSFRTALIIIKNKSGK